MVLAAIVGLWLLWVAPFVLGRTTPAFAGTRRQTPTTGTRRPGGSMMTMTAPQDDPRHPETTWDAPGTTPGTAVVRSRTTTSGQQPFTPRWGRIAVALTGLLCLIGTLVTLVLGAIGVVSLLVPLACLGGTAASVAVLRLLAVRARRDRVNRAFADAMAPVRDLGPEEAPRAAPVDPAPAAPTRPTVLFDAEETPGRALTAMEQRTAALAGLHGSSAVDVRDAGPAEGGPATLPIEPAGSAAPSVAAPGSTAWAPVDVPRPTYVGAAKAERQAPAPLDLPEAPKAASRMPIKAAEAAARVAATAADPLDVTDTAAPTDDAAPATGRINLDDVLQRRRA
ncbi:hypothetical protein [Arthrobacter antioxidans]|uniref:hypothetical protein n=1 Tax=Arthrobacter antioxidans TaxID=2895818 RepID=UPI0020001F35|nr:hypothetical protein [Arthrobacter antioxidans]